MESKNTNETLRMQSGKVDWFPQLADSQDRSFQEESQKENSLKSSSLYTHSEKRQTSDDQHHGQHCLLVIAVCFLKGAAGAGLEGPESAAEGWGQGSGSSHDAQKSLCANPAGWAEKGIDLWVNWKKCQWRGDLRGKEEMLLNCYSLRTLPWA